MYLEDYKIVDLYWARSEDAIRQTEIKYGRMLVSISSALVPTVQDAEECVSDTYVAAWESMPDERPIYLGAFLSKIIRRISIDKYRREHSQKRGGMENFIDELGECIPSETDLQTEYDNRRLSELLNTFLRSLDEQKRTIFVRRYFFSDSISDIAEMLGVSEGKTKTVLHRTRNELRKFLEREGVAI
jgi:RNA polymerase sigma-70 factor (ECF subfamily)